MDYFLQLLEQTYERLKQGEHTLLEDAVKESDKSLVPKIETLQLEEEVLMVAQTQYNQNRRINCKDIGLIPFILGQYDSHRKVEIKDRSFESLDGIFENFEDCSIVIRYRDTIFDPERQQNWTELNIQEEDEIEIYAKHPTDKKRSNSAIKAIQATLGERIVEDETKPYHGFIHKRVKSLRKLHLRPMKDITIITDDYPGTIYARNKSIPGSAPVDAKSILFMAMLQVAEGQYLDMYYSPPKNQKQRNLLEKIHKKIIKIAQTEENPEDLI